MPVCPQHTLDPQAPEFIPGVEVDWDSLLFDLSAGDVSSENQVVSTSSQRNNDDVELLRAETRNVSVGSPVCQAGFSPTVNVSMASSSKQSDIEAFAATRPTQVRMKRYCAKRARDQCDDHSVHSPRQRACVRAVWPSSQLLTKTDVE